MEALAIDLSSPVTKYSRKNPVSCRAQSKKPGFFLSLRLSPNILKKTRFLATHRIMVK
jgi:hypothetical protein